MLLLLLLLVVVVVAAAAVVVVVVVVVMMMIIIMINRTLLPNSSRVAHSGGSGFKSRPGDRLSGTEKLRVSLVSPSKRYFKSHHDRLIQQNLLCIIRHITT